MTIKKIHKRNILICSLLLASAIAALLVGSQLSTSAQTDQERPQTPRATPTPMPRRIVELNDPEWREDLPLVEKVAQSKVIAIGVPVKNVGRRSPDGMGVTTDFEVRIQEVIKGDIQPDSTISISMPGGMVTEPDRSLLVARARLVRYMQNNRAYLMFLKEAPENTNSPYVIFHGSQGLYEIPKDGMRVIHLGRSFELPPADDGELINTFLEQVRASVTIR